MTPLNKTVRRVTLEEYGYGRNRRKLVVALEKGDLIMLREQGCRTRHTARLYDLYWWLLRCEAEKVRADKLRERQTGKEHDLPTAARQPHDGARSALLPKPK
jgi:hypothetical protein